MAKRKKDRGTKTPEWVSVPRSSLVLIATTGWMAAVLGALYLLRANDIKLGQGSLYYRYSTLEGVRAIMASPALGLAGLAAATVFLVSRRGAMRVVGGAAAVLLMVLCGIWIWWAP